MKVCPVFDGSRTQTFPQRCVILRTDSSRGNLRCSALIPNEFHCPDYRYSTSILNIEIAEKDRDFFRFLWKSDPSDAYSKNHHLSISLSCVWVNLQSNSFKRNYQASSGDIRTRFS